MPSAAYNSSSLGWQVRQGIQRFREWAEYRASQTDVDLPDWNWPDWNLPPEVGQILFWSGIAAVSIWLGWLLFRALEPAVKQWLAREQKWVTLGGAQVVSVDEAHSDQYWWQQAQACAQQGQYGEACKALYRATLQQLHDSQRLLHKSSRTDGEYLEKLGQDRPLSRPYQLLIGTHERLVFGSAIASAETFQRCRQAYEELQKK